jgi:hypothetical protein
MNERQWLRSNKPRDMVQAMHPNAKFRYHGSKVPGPLDRRKLRLFACACGRRIWDLLGDERSRRAVEVAEAFADGRAGKPELAAAEQAAEQARQDLIERVIHAETPAGFTEVKESELLFNAAWLAVLTAAQRDLLFAVRSAAWVAAIACCRWQAPPNAPRPGDVRLRAQRQAETELAVVLRDLFGNPYRPAGVEKAWLAWDGGTVVQLADAIYAERAFDRLPILADALEEAGCTDTALLGHLRGPGPHVRGCWALDLLLRKP